MDDSNEIENDNNENQAEALPVEVKKLAVFDAEGLPTAFFSTDIHDDIPVNALEITFEQWNEFIANNGFRKWDGSNVVPYTPPTPPLTWEAISTKQQALLERSDFRVLPDTPLTPEKLQEWVLYRQALRAVNNIYATPDDVIWPEEPA